MKWKRLWALLLIAFCAAAVPARADSSDGVVAGEGAGAQPADLSSAGAAAKRIEVNLSTLHLTGWEGDRVVFEFAVTAGQEGQPTIPGEYEILDKEEQAYSYGWNMSLPFWLGIYQFSDYENGFHALPVTPDGEELWGDALGVYAASHGCIVLARADAQRLFEWADIGTKVIIRD